MAQTDKRGSQFATAARQSFRDSAQAALAPFGMPVTLTARLAQALRSQQARDALAKKFERFTSLDTPQDETAAEIAADIGAGFIPGVGQAQAVRDFERARRLGDLLGMGLSAAGAIPIAGGASRAANKARTIAKTAEKTEKLTPAQKANAAFLETLGKTPEQQQAAIEREAEKIARTMNAGARSEEDLLRAARAEATRKLRWQNYDKPQTESVYGRLERSQYSDPLPQRLRNTPDVVAARAAASEEFLKRPTERWVPREYAFPRASIRDALEGFPGKEQTQFTRYTPTARTDLSYVDEIYDDPRNRNLIKAQIARGLPLGGETFYASLWPVMQEAMDRGMTRQQVERWIEGVAPGSARNSILNENAVGNMMYAMNAKGIPLTEQNVKNEMQRFRQQYNIGLPLMDVHRKGAADVLERGQSLRDKLTAPINKASDVPEYKIPTYGVQKTGDFKHSWVGDTHEASGETLASRYHPYFREQGGFNPSEYGRAEKHMQNISAELGIPTGMGQAGRWFGGGELTGLRSPRGDALDLLEKQVAYTLKQTGKEVTPQSVRDATVDLVRQGGDLLPWFQKTGMPDYRF